MRHHTNWHLKALEKMPRQAGDDFFSTAPFSISVKDFQLFRRELVGLIDGMAKRIEKSEPEILAVIDVDLFRTWRSGVL